MMQLAGRETGETYFSNTPGKHRVKLGMEPELWQHLAFLHSATKTSSPLAFWHQNQFLLKTAFFFFFFLVFLVKSSVAPLRYVSQLCLCCEAVRRLGIAGDRRGQRLQEGCWGLSGEREESGCAAYLWKSWTGLAGFILSPERRLENRE